MTKQQIGMARPSVYPPNGLGRDTYIDGNKDFKGLDGNDFKLSKYDGHPNENAHLLIEN